MNITGPDGQYYVQDSRGFVGNDLLWWAIDGKGYTCDLSKAHVFTKDEAFDLCMENGEPRHFVPWPKDYIDAATRPVIDHQYVKLEQAGVTLPPKPKPKPRPMTNCDGCGRFLTPRQDICGCDNCGSAP